MIILCPHCDEHSEALDSELHTLSFFNPADGEIVCKNCGARFVSEQVKYPTESEIEYWQKVVFTKKSP